MRKRARTDLCGGRPVMVVPTATKAPVSGELVMISRVESARMRLRMPSGSVGVSDFRNLPGFYKLGGR